MSLTGISNTVQSVMGSEEGRTLVGDATNFMQGAGQALGGVGGALVEGAGNVGGGVGNIVSGVSSMQNGPTASGIGDVLGGGMGLASMVTDSVPYLSTAGNAVSAAGHAMEAYNASDQMNGDWTGNKFWTETGAATLGGINTLASLDPTGISTLTSSAVQGGVNLLGSGLGWLSGGSLGFSAASATGATERALWNTGSTVAGGLQSAYNWVTS